MSKRIAPAAALAKAPYRAGSRQVFGQYLWGLNKLQHLYHVIYNFPVAPCKCSTATLASLTPAAPTIETLKRSRLSG